MQERDEEILPVLFGVMYQTGQSDGYTHSHGGALHESYAAAEFAGKKEHGNYAVDPKAVAVVTIAGRVYKVDGPYKTVKDVEMEKTVRATALAKLSEIERRVLGLIE